MDLLDDDYFQVSLAAHDIHADILMMTDEFQIHHRGRHRMKNRVVSILPSFMQESSLQREGQTTE